MKVQAGVLVTSIAILRTVDLTKMKLSTAYKVRQILTKSQDTIDDFETRRMAIAEKHGTLNKEKTRYDFKTQKARKAYEEELNVLLTDELDMDIKPIHIDLLDEYIDIEPQNVPFVEWFVEGLE